MTPEHREQFLSTEGWQQTERGHVRGEWFWNSTGTGSIWVTNHTNPTVKFRRFPFGRQPKHDAMVGWFVRAGYFFVDLRRFVLESDDEMEKNGGLRELNETAARAEEIRKTPGHVQEYQQLVVDFWLKSQSRNKRQGWKTINVDGEKTVVEVMG